jgi:hypothetical protein
MLKRQTEGSTEIGLGALTSVQLLKGAMGPVPFTFAPKGVLAQLRPSSIALWDTATWKIARTLPLEGAFAVGSLADDGLIAVSKEAAGGARVLKLTEPAGAPQSFLGPLEKPFLFWAYAFPDKTPSSFLYVSPNSQYSLQQVVLTEDGKARTASLLPMGPEDYGSVISVADGTVVYYEGGTHHVVQASPQALPIRAALPASVRAIRHLAKSSLATEIWTSDDAGSVRRLKLSDPAQVVFELPPGPGKVFHLAASSTHLAVLWFDQLADGTVRSFTLVVHDQTGKELFRTLLPPYKRPEQRFVAVGPTAVVCGGSESFLAWSLDTGKPLVP